MESANPETIPQEPVIQPEKGPIALEMEDVGNLDEVLRSYYLSQIKSIDVRKDRKLARKLLENHLVLPKSRQRTSKDAAYIKEMLGIEGYLLARLEDSRLIRRLNKTGTNPIYEISHDTLVEPILAERSDREAILRFFKKYGKYFALLLLLLFGLGMLFENKVDVLDDSLGRTRTGNVPLEADEPLFVSPGNTRAVINVPFNEIESYKKMDSLMLEIGVKLQTTSVGRTSAEGETLRVDLGAMDIPLPAKRLEALISEKRDTAIPLQLMLPIGRMAQSQGEQPGQMMATVEGTTLLRIQHERGGLGPARILIILQTSNRIPSLIQTLIIREQIGAFPPCRQIWGSVQFVQEKH